MHSARVTRRSALATLEAPQALPKARRTLKNKGVPVIAPPVTAPLVIASASAAPPVIIVPADKPKVFDTLFAKFQESLGQDPAVTAEQDSLLTRFKQSLAKFPINPCPSAPILHQLSGQMEQALNQLRPIPAVSEDLLGKLDQLFKEVEQKAYEQNWRELGSRRIQVCTGYLREFLEEDSDLVNAVVGDYWLQLHYPKLVKALTERNKLETVTRLEQEFLPQLRELTVYCQKAETVVIDE